MDKRFTSAPRLGFEDQNSKPKNPENSKLLEKAMKTHRKMEQNMEKAWGHWSSCGDHQPHNFAPQWVWAAPWLRDPWCARWPPWRPRCSAGAHWAPPGWPKEQQVLDECSQMKPRVGKWLSDRPSTPKNSENWEDFAPTWPLTDWPRMKSVKGFGMSWRSAFLGSVERRNKPLLLGVLIGDGDTVSIHLRDDQVSFLVELNEQQNLPKWSQFRSKLKPNLYESKQYHSIRCLCTLFAVANPKLRNELPDPSTRPVVCSTIEEEPRRRCWSPHQRRCPPGLHFLPEVCQLRKMWTNNIYVMFFFPRVLFLCSCNNNSWPWSLSSRILELSGPPWLLTSAYKLFNRPGLKSTEFIQDVIYRIE